MQGPDYTQWHGAYEMLSDLAQLKADTQQMMSGAGMGQ
jgi:hypothetical protein